MTATSIRALKEGDLEAYVALRRQALLDSPLAFAASPADDFAGSIEALRPQLERAPDWIVIGAFHDVLVGSVGLIRDSHEKASHKVHLWGMFVTPAFRRQGIAAKLLAAAIDYARAIPGASWLHLGVSTAAPEARRLYERAGFQRWGTEPAALRHAGETVDEDRMALQLH